MIILNTSLPCPFPICTLALWTVYMTQEPLSIPQMRSYPITLFTVFELTVGLIDMPVDHTVWTHPVVHVVFCCFSVVSHLLLLSLLTAMMSDTQWRVGQERDELWRTQVNKLKERNGEPTVHKLLWGMKYNVGWLITVYCGFCTGGSHHSYAGTSAAAEFLAKAGHVWSALWPGRPLVSPVRNASMMTIIFQLWL